MKNKKSKSAEERKKPDIDESYDIYNNLSQEKKDEIYFKEILYPKITKHTPFAIALLKIISVLGVFTLLLLMASGTLLSMTMNYEDIDSFKQEDIEKYKSTANKGIETVVLLYEIIKSLTLFMIFAVFFDLYQIKRKEKAFNEYLDKENKK